MMKDISTTSGQAPFLPFHFSDFYRAGTNLLTQVKRPTCVYHTIQLGLCTIPSLDCMLVLLLMMTLTSDR